jgi:hypothetical protein
MTENPLLRLAQLLGPCPECGNGRMEAVHDDDGTTNFLCRSCGCCWHAELEWSRRVDPLTCPGCSARHVCEAARRPFGAVLPQRS